MFPEKGISRNEIINEITDLCKGDYTYKSGKILNSICTAPIDIAKEIFFDYSDTNLGDKRIFGGSAQLEKLTVETIGSLLGNHKCFGNIISGGTEANLLAAYVAREKFSRKNPGSIPEIIAPVSAHFSVRKICKILNLKPVFTPLHDKQHADVEAIEKSITNKTAIIIATAGTSELGAVDNIPSIAKIAKERHIYFHVDAATGGFLIPFVNKLGYNLPELNLKTEGISSLTVDPHKFGLSVIPAGIIIFNEEKDYESVNFKSFFEGTPNHRCLLGTRSGASAIATYATIKNIGFNGYMELTQNYFLLRKNLHEMLKANNLDFFLPPDLNIVTLPHNNAPKAVAFFEEKGWIVSKSENYKCLRLVLAKHVTHSSLEQFFKLYLKSLQLV